MEQTETRRKRWRKRKKKKSGEVQPNQKLLVNVQAFSHWSNIFHFISMTKNTIILDMPECRFH